jgi:hypothetical protein
MVAAMLRSGRRLSPRRPRAKPVEEVLQHRRLLRREVAGRLLAQHVEQVDMQAGHLEVLVGGSVRKLRVAEVDRHRLGEQRHQVVEARRTETRRGAGDLQTRRGVGFPAGRGGGLRGGRLGGRRWGRRRRWTRRLLLVEEAELVTQRAVGREDPLVGDLDVLAH